MPKPRRRWRTSKWWKHPRSTGSTVRLNEERRRDDMVPLQEEQGAAPGHVRPHAAVTPRSPVAAQAR
ncbi:hypothetical protein O6A27_27285 [Escherichia coli]|nr:hypothetical protein [Escherichia coli]